MSCHAYKALADFSHPVLQLAGSAFRYNAQYGAQLITVNTTTATFRLFSAYGANAYLNLKASVPRRWSQQGS